MKKNMGSLDRFIRLAIVMLISFLSMKAVINGTLSLILLGVSIIFLLTSLIGYCPLYSVFGIQTCPKDKK